ncbi:MAG: site-2 protease family protein [Actinobacteria bacterium]|nr:site-2 protease family protein [Actinomycetota bacterium]
MRGSIRIARVAGIDVEAHWSWLFIVALVVWSLAAGVFPDTNPGHGNGTYAAMAVVAALLLFLSLGLHELGHALVARREGMQIDGITLWLLGGVARFGGGRFPSARAELRIALAGPLVSLAIGGALLAFALAVPLPSAVDGVVFWLGYVNLALLAFNLLPALPLDGGRVLRALLWARRGDLGEATRTASAIGRAFGRVLIGAGIVMALFGYLGGIWFALIGWFLTNAAAQEELAAPQGRLAHLRIGDVTIRELDVVPDGTTLERFLEDDVVRTRHTVYPVVSGGPVAGNGSAIVGLISFRDAQRVPRAERARHLVTEAMVPVARVRVLDADAPLVEHLSELLSAPLRRTLVREDGRIAGMLSPTDALRVVDVLRR